MKTLALVVVFTNFPTKGWYLCHGTKKNIQNNEMFEITEFEISSINCKSFLR